LLTWSEWDKWNFKFNKFNEDIDVTWATDDSGLEKSIGKITLQVKVVGRSNKTLGAHNHSRWSRGILRIQTHQRDFEETR